MGRGGQDYQRRAEEDRKNADDAKRLYVCTHEFLSFPRFNRYRVHAIKLSDLFTTDLTPIPLFSSQSDSQDLQQFDPDDPQQVISSSPSDSVDLQQVPLLEGDDVPFDMGVGVFGSRIVLTGGWEGIPTRTYVLETDKSVEPKPRFISSSTWIRKPYLIPGCPETQIRPWLEEIDGKLYALSTLDSWNQGPAFNVFDPKTKAWASLPSLPTEDIDLVRGPLNGIRPSNVAVVGTKIHVTLCIKYEPEGKLLCFDVADPNATWSDCEPPFRDYIGLFPGFFNKVLVVDLVVDSKEEKEKLLFTFDDDDDNIQVSRMVLSPQGETDCIDCIEHLAEISLSGALEGLQPIAYSCVHLGGQLVCFSFFRRSTLYVLTFKYSYSKSAASPPLVSCTAAVSDSEILTCESICGSFSVQTLGLRLFQYNTNQRQCVLNAGGCFVL